MEAPPKTPVSPRLTPRWLSFQWDILLLETGFAAILYAPSFSLSTPRARPAAAHPMTWVLRAQVLTT